MPPSLWPSLGLSPFVTDDHRAWNWQTNPEGKGLALRGAEQAKLKGKSEYEDGELSTSTRAPRTGCWLHGVDVASLKAQGLEHSRG